MPPTGTPCTWHRQRRVAGAYAAKATASSIGRSSGVVPCIATSACPNGTACQSSRSSSIGSDTTITPVSSYR
jgi:hypothetical protein